MPVLWEKALRSRRVIRAHSPLPVCTMHLFTAPFTVLCWWPWERKTLSSSFTMAPTQSMLVLLMMMSLELCSLSITRVIPDTRALWWTWAKNTPMWLKRPEQEVYLHPEVPIKYFLVNNWVDIEEIWYHAFYELLMVHWEHPVLLTKSLLNPKDNRR